MAKQKLSFMEKHTSNTQYGKKIVESETERLAHFLADRAVQYSMEWDEIESRLDCFFPYEFINRVCVITQQIYKKLEDDARQPETMSQFLGRKLLPRR